MTTSPASVASSVSTIQHRSSKRERAQRVGVCVIVVVALIDFWRWHALAAKWISVGRLGALAPSTAWLLIVLGIALGLRLFFPRRAMAGQVAAVLSALAALATLHLLFCHLNGRVPSWESWFGFGELTVEQVSVSHMSSRTAVLALVTNFALIALFSPQAGRTVWRDAGILAALAVELYGLVTVVSYAAGNPPLGNDGWFKVAPLVLFEFTLFNFVLLMGGRATSRLRNWFFGTDPLAPDFAPLSREERLVTSLLAGVGLITLTASVVYLRSQTASYLERTIEVLQRMADLKVSQIDQWRRERLGDANSLRQMPGFDAEMKAVSSGSGESARRTKFLQWLRQYTRNYGYTNIVVFDAALRPVFSEAGTTELSVPGLSEQLSRLRPDSGVVELPPYVDAAGRLRWDLLVPLLATGSATFDGAILLQTDPDRFIIPILQSWPEEYQTGQSGLWHRAGDRLILLGGFRPGPGVTPDELRPLGMIRNISSGTPPSVLTRFVRGELSAGEGPDHRHVTIIGLGRLIANSPWLLTSRVDSAEVYRPLRRTAIGIAGIVAGLVVITGFATGLLWRQRQKNLLHDRLTAELEQKRATARLGLVMRHAKDIIIVGDEKFKFVDVNQQAVDTYGWTREELRQMTVSDLRAAETQSSFMEIAERVNSAEGAIYETIHQRKDGTRFPVEVSMRRVEIDGEPQMLAIVRDISERKRAEAQLRDSEEKFSKAFQANPSGIAITDLASGRFIEVNESFCRIMRYSPHDVIGHTSVELGIWGGGGDRDRMFQPLFDGRPLRNFELQTRTRDGEAKTVLVNAELIELRGNKKVLSLIEDITERKRTEAKLRQLSSIIEQAPISVVISDLNGVIEYVNPKCCTVSGFSREELIGRAVRTLRSEETPPEVYRDLWSTVADDRVWNGEFYSLKKDGESYLENVVAAPLVGEDGRPRHIVALKDDITARKRSEAELAKERELSQMKSQFISVASHEFRTPLAAAVGSLELLERHAGRLTEAKRAELIARIKNSLSRLTTIMDDVLQLSRADSGRVKVKRTMVDLVQAVQDLIREVESGDRHKHLFGFQHSGRADAVPVDTNLVSHIISNLLGNAVRYSPEGTTISVTLEIGAAAFSLTVADEGIGIPEAERERVFEPFVRGSNVGQIKGTGLGLNIVKRYTELMGGSIELRPTERGAAFHINIPLPPPEAPA